MDFVIIFIKAFVLLQIIMGLASFATWFERKGSALIQNRIGANRAGSFLYTDVVLLKPVFAVLRLLGILGVINTLVCDAFKAITKEDFIPEGVSPFIHALAPFLSVVPVFLAFALLPFGPNFVLFDNIFTLQLVDLNVAVLFVLACGSISVYGVTLAGWTGNNKFSLLGGLRAAGQMISYELAMGIAFVTMIVWYGTMDFYEIVDGQKILWGVIAHPITFVILFIVGMAETKRGPFDLPESESELVAGYFTEYSGMKFLVFWLGEFAEIALFAFIMALMFFGGWHLPFLELPETWWASLVGHGILMGKVVLLIMLQIVIRWTLPRFRYDQLMNLGWKYLLPLSIVNLMVMSFIALLLEQF